MSGDNDKKSAFKSKCEEYMFWKKKRYIVAFLTFFGLFNSYCLRSNLSIAIVAMTEEKEVVLPNGTITHWFIIMVSLMFVQILGIISRLPPGHGLEREFDWDSKLQGYMLSSFFYGYITTQLFGGWLSMKIGGKHVFGWGIFITAVLTLITPPAIYLNSYLLLVIRVLEGIFEGVTYPCIHAIFSRWAPPLERSKMVTIAMSGSPLGTVISMPVSAALADALGWPSVFYFFGGLGVLWFVVWMIVISDSPETDKFISQEELEYIKSTLSTVDVTDVKHPWREIMTSGPVWALVFAHFCDNWGFYTFLTQLPTFLKDVLDYNLTKTGFMAALPYLVMTCTTQTSGHIADWLRSRQILSTLQVRKLFNTAGFALHIGFMLGAAFWLNKDGVMFCLVMAVGVGMISWAGFGVNFLDIAPQHASVIFGFTNTFATVPGIISPIITGYIVATPTREEWQIVFCLACGIYLVGALMYFIFASADVQPWALPKEPTQEKTSEAKKSVQLSIDTGNKETL